MYARGVGLILRLRHSEEGQAYVEYVVLGALAVLAILGSIQFFFGAISALFTRLGEMLGSL
jgi:Flp pilus assembly pilin Flp